MALKKPPFTVGVVGASGSGKHALTAALLSHFKDCVLLTETDYARSHDELAYPERVRINYEHPASYDSALLAAHLRGLRWGNAVETPVYDKIKHLRAPDTRRIASAPLIIVRGPLLYADESLAAQFDFRIFLDTDPDLRIIRHILQKEEEKQSLYTTVEQYLATGRPTYERFIAPQKEKADLILTGDGGGPNSARTAIAAIEAEMAKK